METNVVRNYISVDLSFFIDLKNSERKSNRIKAGIHLPDEEGKGFVIIQMNYMNYKISFASFLLLTPICFGFINVGDWQLADKLALASRASMAIDCNGTQGVEKIVCLANAAKALLTPEQIATLQIEYNLTNAKTWSNFPAALYPRLGLSLGSLNAIQLEAVKTLLKEASGSTPNEGWNEIQQVWLADDYLNTKEPGGKYGVANYYISFLGMPAMSGTFEILMTGHHYTIANTYMDGEMVGATPRFNAVEPYSFETTGVTFEPLSQERGALADLLDGLTKEQLAIAKSPDNFKNILLIPHKNWEFPTTFSGLQCNKLSPSQKQLVIDVIKTYTNDLSAMTASKILAKYVTELDNTFITYSGTTALATQNDYMRIDGPSVWIEFSVQKGQVLPNVPYHFHSIWRDRITDYGGTHK